VSMHHAGPVAAASAVLNGQQRASFTVHQYPVPCTAHAVLRSQQLLGHAVLTCTMHQGVVLGSQHLVCLRACCAMHQRCCAGISTSRMHQGMLCYALGCCAGISTSHMPQGMLCYAPGCCAGISTSHMAQGILCCPSTSYSKLHG
jgi:hypothetical protein